jgi:Flp pilus assembly protein TadD
LQPYYDAVADDLDDVDAQRELALVLWEGGQFEQALEHFERAVQIDANNPRSLNDLGRAYERLGRPSDAEGAFRRMATIPSTYHVALYEMGRLSMRQGDLGSAVRYLNESVRSKPDYMPALYSLGVAHEQAGRPREAYQTYAKVLQLEPPEERGAVLDYLDALYRMGKLDLEMGAVERAAEILTEVVAAYPLHPEAHGDLGKALQMLGREEEAQRAFAEHEKLRGGTSAP